MTVFTLCGVPGFPGWKWKFMRDRCKLCFPRPLLARSREAHFACPKRRACSQATYYIKVDTTIKKHDSRKKKSSISSANMHNLSEFLIKKTQCHHQFLVITVCSISQNTEYKSFVLQTENWVKPAFARLRLRNWVLLLPKPWSVKFTLD